MRRTVVIFTGLFLVALAAYFVLKLYANDQARKEVDRIVSRVSPLVELDYEHVETDLFRRVVRIKDLVATRPGDGERVRVGECILSPVSSDEELRYGAHVIFKNLNMDLSEGQMKKLGRSLKDLGYEKMRGKADLFIQYSAERQQLDLDRLHMTVENMGQVSIELRLANVSLPDPSALGNPITLFFMLPGITLIQGELAYQDDSLIRRLLIQRAKKEGKTAEELAVRWQEVVHRRMGLEKSHRFNRNLGAIGRFLGNPSQIVLQAAPEKPVTVAEFIGVKHMGELVELLGVEIYSGGNDLDDAE